MKPVCVHGLIKFTPRSQREKFSAASSNKITERGTSCFKANIYSEIRHYRAVQSRSCTRIMSFEQTLLIYFIFPSFIEFSFYDSPQFRFKKADISSSLML